MQRASRDYRKWVLLIETTTEQHQILKSDQWEITELRLSGWQETRIRRGGGQQQVTGDGRCCRGLSSSLWWQGQLQLQRWELRWGHAAQEAILAQSAWAGGDAPAPQPSWEDQTLQYAWQTQLLLPWGRKSDLFSSLPESPWFTQHRHVPRSPTVSAECWAAAAETSTQWAPRTHPTAPEMQQQAHPEGQRWTLLRPAEAQSMHGINGPTRFPWALFVPAVAYGIILKAAPHCAGYPQ